MSEFRNLVGISLQKVVVHFVWLNNTTYSPRMDFKERKDNIVDLTSDRLVGGILN